MREGAESELLAGGFSAVYEVYKAMEQAGRIRRGYFVAGHGATQFALPGADDRLRALREASETPRTWVLAATDPASPYGASVAWPKAPAGSSEDRASPQRALGAHVIVHDGALLGWLARNGHTLLTFGDEALAHASTLAKALASLNESGHRRALLLVTIDGEPAARTRHLAAFQSVGFTLGTRGLLLRTHEKSFLSRPSVAR